MTAAELPVGAVFTHGRDSTLYTVTHQHPGRDRDNDLTQVEFFNPWLRTHGNCTFAGHAEVIHHPRTLATNSTETAP